MAKIRLRLQSLESREVPNGTQLFAVSEDSGKGRVAVYKAGGEVAQSPGVPGSPVHIIQSGTLLATFEPYLGFGGGVRVAVGDVTGDFIDDVITAAGFGGGPHVKVYDGASILAGSPLMVKEFFAFDAAFHGGVFVAVGQMNPATPQKEIIVAAGETGGPHVKVFAMQPLTFVMIPAPTDVYQLQQTSSFFAYSPNFTGGVHVAAADVNGDGRDDVVTGPGAGGGPHVRVFNVFPPDPLALPPAPAIVIDEFFAYDASFTGGVYVAAGNVMGDAQFAEVVTGPGEGGGPHVKVFARNSNGKLAKAVEGFAGSENMTGGTRVGLADLGQDLDNPQPRPFTIYVGHGPFLSITLALPMLSDRLRAFKVTSPFFDQVSLDLDQEPFSGDFSSGWYVGE